MLVLQAVSLCWGVRRVRVSAVCWACQGFRGRALEEELEDDGHDPDWVGQIRQMESMAGLRMESGSGRICGWMGGSF